MHYFPYGGGVGGAMAVGVSAQIRMNDDDDE